MSFDFGMVVGRLGVGTLVWVLVWVGELPGILLFVIGLKWSLLCYLSQNGLQLLPNIARLLGGGGGEWEGSKERGKRRKGEEKLSDARKKSAVEGIVEGGKVLRMNEVTCRAMEPSLSL